MEFTPVVEVYEHAATNKNQETQLEFRLQGSAVDIAYDNYQDDVALILEALDSIFRLDINGVPQGQQYGVHNLILYKKVQQICIAGRAPELLEGIEKKIRTLTSLCTRALITRGRTTPADVLSITAEIWQHFTEAVLYLSKILLYADKKYLAHTEYGSWRQFCVSLFNSNLERSSFLFNELLSAIITQLLTPKQAELEYILTHSDTPKQLTPFNGEIRVAVQMFLDLERYNGAFIESVLKATEEHYKNLIETFKSAPTKNPVGIKLATYLASSIVQESSRFLTYFHESSEREAVKCVLSQFLVDNGALFLADNEHQNLCIYKPEFPIPIDSKNPLMDLILKQQDALLQIVFFVFVHQNLFTRFAETWCQCIHHLVRTFIDFYFPQAITYESMGSKQKLTSVTALVDLTDRLSRLASSTLDTTLLKPKFTKSKNATLQSSEDFISRAKNCILSFNVHDENLHGLLQTKTREAFTFALNVNHKSSQALARCFVFHLDYLLRHGLEGAEEAQFKVMLRRLIVLFRSLEAKILIGTLHESAMAQRLFTGKARYMNIERLFVQLLSDECGEAFVQRMQFVVSEYESSEGFSKEFQKTVDLKEAKTEEFQNCEFRVTVVPVQVWPKRASISAVSSPSSSEMGEVRRITEIISYDVPIQLPPQVLHCNEAFTNFYRKTFENRVLKFALHDSSATIKFTPKCGQTKQRFYQLSVNAFQTLLLLAFNCKESLAPAELAAILEGLEQETIEENINSLVIDSNRQILVLKNGRFHVNHEFTFLKNQVPLKILATNQKNERDVSSDLVNQARSDQISLIAIDAFLVRFMKAKRTATFNEIFASLITENLGAPAVPEVVKARLQHLTEKDFLSFEPPDIYQYEA